MFNFTLNELQSKELLRASLQRGSANLFLKAVEESNVSILSVWKPARRFTIADILVARVVAASAKLGAHCTVFFSYPWQGIPLKDVPLHREQRFCIHFYKDIYSYFCEHDSVSVNALRPTPVTEQTDLEFSYSNFLDECKSKKGEFVKKILSKRWVTNSSYALSLIATVFEMTPTFIICGKKHDWIWDGLFRGVIDKYIQITGNEVELPEILYIRDIEGPKGRRMDENEQDNRLFIHSSFRDIVNCLNSIEQQKLRQSGFVQKTLKWFVFPSINDSIQMGSETVKNYKEWEDSSLNGRDRISYTARAIFETLRPIKSFSDSYQQLLSELPRVEITDRTIVDTVQSSLFFDTDFFENIGIDDEKPNPPTATFVDPFFRAGGKALEQLIINDDIREIIRSFFIKCKTIDSLLHIFRKRYRDHFAHQFNVFGLGLLLLEYRISPDQTLCEYISKKEGIGLNEVKSAWAFASLLHDHALPLEYLLELHPRIEAISSIGKKEKELGQLEGFINVLQENIPDIYCNELNLNNDQIANNVKEIITKLFDDIKIIGLKKDTFEEDFPLGPLHIDHGILGAANLARKLKKDNLMPDWILISLHAIACHNTRKLEFLDFNKSPLSVLLALCDELHEWQRPILVKNEFVCPIDKIYLNLPAGMDEGGEMIPECLEIEFHCTSRMDLQKCGWDEKLFLSGKQKAMEKIQLSSEVNPKRLVMFVKVPSEFICEASCSI